MHGHIGTGIDWDHYDNGPGSEKWIHNRKKEQAEFDKKVWNKKQAQIGCLKTVEEMLGSDLSSEEKIKAIETALTAMQEIFENNKC